MQKISNILGIIIARGGSKRVPHKNIAPINGKPLLAYTCEAALGSKLLTRTVLSTDDEEIASVGRTHGVEVPFLRPKELASDDSNPMDAITHLLSELKKREQYETTIVVLLQPTSPFRTALHIDKSIELLQQTDADSVVSVVEVPHVCKPYLVMKIDNGKLVPEMPGAKMSKNKIYAYNGALYTMKSDSIGHSKALFGDDCRPFVMGQEHSLDIDTELDMEIAEYLMRRKQAS